MTARLAGAATAFEVERETLYGPAGAEVVVEVLSTTDTDIFRPLVEGWLATRPDLALRSVAALRIEAFRALAAVGAAFDLVIASAMDLQIKLADDGMARPPEPGAALPAWARWRDMVFTIAREPAVPVRHRDALGPGEAVPRARRDLIALRRAHPQRFAGRVAT